MIEHRGYVDLMETNLFDYTHAKFDHEVSVWWIREIWAVGFLLGFY